MPKITKTSSGKVVATSFPYPQVHRSIAGDVPIYLKLAFKVTHPFRKRRFLKLSFSFASAIIKYYGYLLAKTAKLRFVPPFGRIWGNVHGLSMARWKARGQLPISANLFFRELSRLRHYERILVKIVVFERGGSLWAQISGGRVVIHQRLLASEN